MTKRRVRSRCGCRLWCVIWRGKMRIHNAKKPQASDGVRACGLGVTRGDALLAGVAAAEVRQGAHRGVAGAARRAGELLVRDGPVHGRADEHRRTERATSRRSGRRPMPPPLLIW